MNDNMNDNMNENNLCEDELAHYGVMGMSWGVHRANKKIAKNMKYEKKAVKMDKKSAKAGMKAEKIHARKDLGVANRAALKSYKYAKKAAKIRKKELNTADPLQKSKLESKAAKYDYKSANMKGRGDRLSKQIGYGRKAMKYSIKSNNYAIKAARARRKIEKNNYYVEKMKRKITELSPEEINSGYKFVQNLVGYEY